MSAELPLLWKHPGGNEQHSQPFRMHYVCVWSLSLCEGAWVNVSHPSVMLKQWQEEEEAAVCGRRMTHQSKPFPLAPPNGRSSPSAFGSLVKENRRWRHAIVLSEPRCYKAEDSRCVPCRTASARLRLTVREKAHPHLDFSCSFQNLHRLKRGKKLTGCTNQSFWWTKHQKQQPQQPLPEQRMIICSVKRRGDTDECRRCAGCVFCIHLCCSSSVAIESMQWNSWPSLF